jgi:hypothetical protein
MTEEWPHIEYYQYETKSWNGESHYDYEFKWIGSKYAVVEIRRIYRQGNDIVDMLPWPVKIIDVVDFDRSYQIVRKDVGFHLWWILVSGYYKIFRHYRYGHFKWRVIKTFEIWGLAYQPEAEITSWRNIGRKKWKARYEKS